MTAPVEVAARGLRAAASGARRPWAGPFAWLLHRWHVLSGSTAAAVVVVSHGVHHLFVAVATLIAWTVSALLTTDTRHPVLKLRTGRPSRHAVAILAVAAFLAATEVISAASLRVVLTTMAVASAAALVASAWRRPRDRPVRAVVVGDSASLEPRLLAFQKRPGLTIVGEVAQDDLADPELPEGRVAALAEATDAEAVIVTPGRQYGAADLQRLSWELEQTGTTLLVGGVVDQIAPHRIAPGTVAGLPVVAVAPSRRTRLATVTKLVVDRVAGALLLVLLSPLLALLAVAVRLDSPGPALFKQRRVGIRGRPFTMYKLRTMRVDPPAVPRQLRRTAGNEVLFKMREDPRVTRLGRFLRRSSLDELPQLINVVRGEMSLIGPRPALYEETARYDRAAWRRTAVMPGITGLWQVSGRSDLSWEESVALDTHYVDNCRLVDDLAIAARTLRAVLRKDGAY